MPEDHSDLEEDYRYYLPEQTTNTDLIETRVLTQSEPVPFKVKQPKETSQDTGLPDNVHPAT